MVLDDKGEGHIGYGNSRCAHQKVDSLLLYGDPPQFLRPGAARLSRAQGVRESCGV